MLKYQESFCWIIPMIGDWHLIKLAAETIRDMLWEGGLRSIAQACGYRKEIHQWKDLHNIFCAFTENINRKALSSWVESSSNISFYSWLCLNAKDDNIADEVTKFWSQSLLYLNYYMAYYFSVRTGNWGLRNGALPKLSEMFFTNSHNKYEELVFHSLKDSIGLPEEIRAKFEKGEWTVSLKS